MGGQRRLAGCAQPRRRQLRELALHPHRAHLRVRRHTEELQRLRIRLEALAAAQRDGARDHARLRRLPTARHDRRHPLLHLLDHLERLLQLRRRRAVSRRRVGVLARAACVGSALDGSAGALGATARCVECSFSSHRGSVSRLPGGNGTSGLLRGSTSRHLCRKALLRPKARDALSAKSSRACVPGHR